MTLVIGIGLGQCIGDCYVIESLLDSGGMGHVYLALDRDLGRRVALKVLPPEQCADARAVDRFMRQARAMARIEHRAVVRVYDRGLHEGVPYVVMEHLVGLNLRARLAQSRLSLLEMLSLGQELCAAVAAVHRQEVLHRDLKPSNVFLVSETPERTASAGLPQLKLLDFGIAKLDDGPPLTETRDMLGTFAYMAPEQLIQLSQTSIQSDIYSLSCILYEMLSGNAPFRARSRAELIAAITHDAPRPLSDSPGALPEGLEALVLQGLSKDPRARPESAQFMARILKDLRQTTLARTAAAHDAQAGHHERAPQAGAIFAHYQLLETLGQGGSGVVYAARDLRDGKRVALKRLHGLHAEDVARLKREFRVLSELSHPNLVRRFELTTDTHDAYFTMEWIEDSAHARAPLLSRCEQQPERVVFYLQQLVAALQLLHQHDLVHRDLKPSNVLVAADERVVLLDFGLTVASSAQSFVLGTPRYMAPEATSGTIGPALDMYALGVLLRELLAAPAAASIPEAQHLGLAQLMAALLAVEPERRPTAAQAAQVLEGLAPLHETKRSDDSSQSTTLFVGRARELSLLTRSFESVRAGAAACVLVRGDSGIGKSALLAQIQREFSRTALCLTSCCRDSEFVPYPALDAAIDGLAAYLAELPQEQLAALLPRHAHAQALAQLFPVLGRIPGLSFRAELPADPAQVRSLAYAGLHRLLQRTSELSPIVLSIDDLHWIDPDSAALLEYLLARPDPPALLLLGSVRSDLEGAPSHAQLMAAMRTVADAVEIQVVEVGELDLNERRTLAERLLGASAVDEAALTRILEQTGGQPFLLNALARHVRDSGADARLDLALAHRLDPSTELAAQRLLELVCVCERPLPLAVLLQVAEGASLETARSLRHAGLARRVLVAGHEGLEPYHVRVREAVLARVGGDARAAHHAALASALSGRPDAQPEALVEHLAGSGQAEQAALIALRTAREAHEQLAFDRAAALYSIALSHRRSSPEQRAECLTLRAAALRNAGRSVEAAGSLLEASVCEPSERSVRLAREAGELLLCAGAIDAGLGVLAPLMERAGLQLPADADTAIRDGFIVFGELATRGLGYQPSQNAVAPEELLRVELCLSLADGLALVDPRGVPFALLALRGALELPNVALLHHALASFVTLTASLFFNPLIEPALDLCRELTARLDTPYARALLYAAEGEAAHFSGQFLVAEAAFERAERILLESCVGATRELAAVRNGAVLLEYAQKGDFASQLERTLAWQASAEVRRDKFHENVLRVAHSIVWIAQDDPEKARRELLRAAGAFAHGGGAYEVGTLSFMDVIDRYEGRADAHLNPLQGRRDILESPAATGSFLAGYMHFQRAWGAIRALERGEHLHSERTLSEQALAGMRLLRSDMWQAVADALQANLAYLADERGVALELLQRAETCFRRLHMRCLAACARARRGELAGHELGTRLVSEAHSELLQLGVKSPARWTLAYFSLFDAARSSELTLMTAVTSA